MNLIEALTEACAREYHGCGNKYCCTHPYRHCSGSCNACLDEIHFPDGAGNGRTCYDCQKLIYYYVCRYSWKYCSEIIRALNSGYVHLDQYPEYNVLSVGCGGAADLMAFELCCPVDRPLFYKGYDMNPLWEPVHNMISRYCNAAKIGTGFRTRNIFDVLADGKPCVRQYNIVVLEYLISSLQNQNRKAAASRLFDGLLVNVFSNRLDDSPFLFIINDIDHFIATDCYDILLDKLSRAGVNFSWVKQHFDERARDYGDGSVKNEDSRNMFQIPEDMKEEFNCAISCSSAQLIVEIR